MEEESTPQFFPLVHPQLSLLHRIMGNNCRRKVKSEGKREAERNEEDLFYGTIAMVQTQVSF